MVVRLCDLARQLDIPDCMRPYLTPHSWYVTLQLALMSRIIDAERRSHGCCLGFPVNAICIRHRFRMLLPEQGQYSSGGPFARLEHPISISHRCVHFLVVSP